MLMFARLAIESTEQIPRLSDNYSLLGKNNGSLLSKLAFVSVRTLRIITQRLFKK